MKIGIGYRHELVPWLARHSTRVSCVEVTAEHFYGAPKRMAAFKAWNNERDTRPSCFVHGLGLSLGTPRPVGPAKSNSIYRGGERLRR